MTVNRTTLLDLPLPVTGTESGTWGDITNNGLAQYVDIAVAGMNSLTSSDFTAGALTISNTQGDSGGTNIAAGSAQYATIKVSSLAQNSTITAPASNRSYRIVNADSTYNLTIKASGQTGITFLPGQTGVVAFTGTDYEVVGVVNAASSTDNAVPKFDGTTGQIIQNTGVTIDDSNNVSGVAQLNATTVDTTNLEVTNIKAKDGTAAGSIADSTGVVTLASSVLTTTDINGGTIDGTIIGGASAAAGSFTTLNTSGAVVFNDAGADVDFRVEGDTEPNLLFVDASTDRVGIGTSTPAARLSISGSEAADYGTAVAANSFLASAAPSTFLTITNTVNTDGTFCGIAFDSFRVGANGSRTYIANIAASTNNAGIMAFGRRTAAGASTESMRIDASGNVGIGTSSPAAKLHVFTGESNANVSSGSDELFIEGSGDSGITIGSGTSAVGRIAFADNGSNGDGFISYSHADTSLRFATNGGTERMRINSSGNVLVNATSGGTARIFAEAGTSTHAIRGNATSAAYVGIYGTHSVDAANGYCAYFNNTGSSTGLYLSNTAAWQSISDSRLKNDVQDLNTTSRLLQLRPVDYLWKNQATSDDPTKRNYGFIAQEVAEVFPELVSTSPDGMFGVEYTGLIAPLVKAVQDLKAELDTVKAELATLKGQ